MTLSIFDDGVMAGVFTILVHAALLFAAFGQFYLLLSVMLRSSSYEHEKLMRGLAGACGLLIYVGSKAMGLSIPTFMYESLSTTMPFSIGLLGVIAPSVMGFVIAWYVVRYLNSRDAVRNVIGMRVLTMIMTYVFFLYCDAYVATYGASKSKDLVYLLPNLSFVLSILLYAVFQYHPQGKGHILEDERERAWRDPADPVDEIVSGRRSHGSAP